MWKTTGAAKPYAIIEAKASYDPTKSLRSLLGEAWDKTERESGGGASSRRGGGAGRRGKRLNKAVADDTLAAVIRRSGYCRHVLFFSIPQAVSHAEAIIKLTAQQSVSDIFHAEHSLTREWRDADLDKVVDNRAGLKNEARKR